MYDILLWFWTGAFFATVAWWVIMWFLVAFVGPVELARMARKLNQSTDDKELSEDEPSGDPSA